MKKKKQRRQGSRTRDRLHVFRTDRVVESLGERNCESQTAITDNNKFRRGPPQNSAFWNANLLEGSRAPEKYSAIYLWIYRLSAWRPCSGDGCGGLAGMRGKCHRLLLLRNASLPPQNYVFEIYVETIFSLQIFRVFYPPPQAISSFSHM